MVFNGHPDVQSQVFIDDTLVGLVIADFALGAVPLIFDVANGNILLPVPCQ